MAVADWISPALVGVGLLFSYVRDQRTKGRETQKVEDLRIGLAKTDRRVGQLSDRVHERIDDVQAEVSGLATKVAAVEARCAATHGGRQLQNG